MKKSIVFLLIAFFISKCFSQNTFSTNLFFEEKINSSRLLKKYHGKYICPPSFLDSILKEETYTIAKVYDTIPFYKDYSILFFVNNGIELGGEEFKSTKLYKNNLIITFTQQDDSTFFMKDCFYKLLNQGTLAFDDVEISYENDFLRIQQFGGNKFGYWGTEFKFKFNIINNYWILEKYSLFTVTSDYGRYVKKKLLWEKHPKKEVQINDVIFSDYFIGDELENIINGFYD